MKELHTRIKQEIENIFQAECNETLIVEFVSDVSERADEILSKSQRIFITSYVGDVLFGVFLPPMYEGDVYHVLLLDERENLLEIMTAMHELEHALLHFRLLKTCYEGDEQKLYKDSLYEYFQIFSEFSAYRKGMSNYLRKVKFDNVTIEDAAVILLEDKLDFYTKNVDTEIKYMRLLQNSIFFGNIIGVLDVSKSDRINKFFEYLEKDEKIAKIYYTMISYRDEKSWYEIYLNVVEDYLCS